MATALQLLLLAAACALVSVAAAGDNAHAPHPALAAGAARAVAPARAATDRDGVINSNAPLRPAHAAGPHLRAPATAPLPSTDLEGLGWTPAHANGTAAGGGDAALGRHRRGAWAC